MTDELRRHVRDVPDYPITGVTFKDLTPLIADPTAFSTAIDWFSERIAEIQPDAIAGTDARGFIFAAPVAHRFALPLVLVRKSGKLPPPVISVEYSLEYADNSKMEIREDAVNAGQRVAVVDDLLATGGTAVATDELISKLGATTVAHLFLIELSFLGGRERISERNPDCSVATKIVYD